MKRTSNRDCREYVQNKEEFKANNVFAVWINENTYCVYSYGTHWILYMWKDGDWFECTEKRSVSTSKHASQAHPLEETIKVERQQELQKLRNV